MKSLWRLYHSAQALLKNGHTSDAASQFERLASAKVRRPAGTEVAHWDDRNPLATRAKLGLCYCYVEQGQLDPALLELESVLSAEPNCPEALCELAYILCLRGKRVEAKTALEQAIAHNPESARAHKALGYFYLQEDDIELAIEECRAAVTCDDSYDPAHVELAVALGRAGRYDEAVRAMSRALQLSPENSDYYYSLAALLRETRRYEDAEKVLLVGLELKPNHRDLLEAMAEVALETGQPESAIDFAHRLLRLERNSLAARDVLGVAYLQLGRVNEALRMADQMVAINPMDPSHHFKKAVLIQQQGKMREAVGVFCLVVVFLLVCEMGDEARQAVESMDNQQMRQIVLLASEDPIFRTKLRRDPVHAVKERGFFLSEAGASALQMLDLDGLTAYGATASTAAYN